MPIDADKYFAEQARLSIEPPKTQRVSAASQTKARNLAGRRAQKERELNSPLASLASGTGATLGGFGTIAGLATGNMDNGLKQFGDSVSDWANERKSQELQRDTRLRSEAIDEAEGIGGKAWAAIRETATNPTLAVDLLASQVPNLIPGAAAGRVASLAGAGAKLANAAAIGTGNLLHSADAAGTTYESLMSPDVPQAEWDNNPAYQDQLAKGSTPDQAKHIVALGQSRQAGL